jgi:putative endonuclease
MNFFYVYVLYNKDKHFLYVGYSEDLKTRVISHNNGEVTSTKTYRPLDLIHYEAYKNMRDAKRREEYFKTTKGRVTLKQMLKEYFANF